MTFTRLPLTVRVPLIAALFMVAVSVFASERVLSRLVDTQTRQVQTLAAVYLDGLALALTDSMVREDVWQVFDILDRSQKREGEIRPTETIVTGADNLVIAASDPVDIPSQDRVPAMYVDPLQHGATLSISEDRQRAFVRRDVLYETQRIGSIYAALDIGPLLAERRQVLWTLILTNIGLTLLLAGAAWYTVGRMMRPIQTLTHYLERSQAGPVEPIPAQVVSGTSSDHQRAFSAFNRMATAVNEREAMGVRLAEEERLASLGRLASGMAHEINNPLGGLFNAIDTLKTHGAHLQVRKSTIALVERGLVGIRDVVRAALMTYRSERDDRYLKPNDIEDLRLLILPEARRRNAYLRWQNNLRDELPLKATVVRQIILNLVLNACQATTPDGWIAVAIEQSTKELLVSVDDEGSGLPAEAKAILTGAVGSPAPFGAGTGLGLWMTNRLVRELNGSVVADTKPAGGTRIVVTIPIHQHMELSRVA